MVKKSNANATTATKNDTTTTTTAPKPRASKKTSAPKIPARIEAVDPPSKIRPAQPPIRILDGNDTIYEPSRYESKPAVIVKTIEIEATKRVTSEVMTKFEYCQVLSLRAKQFEDNHQPYVPMQDISDFRKMAKKELFSKMSPFSIEREMTIVNGVRHVEVWEVNEMCVPGDEKEDSDLDE